MCATLYYGRMSFCIVLKYVAASTAFGSVTLHRSCRRIFIYHSKSSKRNKNVNFQKKQQLLYGQTKEIKQLKQMATIKYNYSS